MTFKNKKIWRRFSVVLMSLLLLTACTKEKETNEDKEDTIAVMDSFSEEKPKQTSEEEKKKNEQTDKKEDTKPSKETSKKDSKDSKEAQKESIKKNTKKEEKPQSEKKPANSKPASSKPSGKKEPAKKTPTASKKEEYKIREEKKTIPYQVFKEESETLPKGQTDVFYKGKDGYEVTKYRDRYVNGQKVDSEIVSFERVAPDDEYVIVGTGRTKGFYDDQARAVHQLLNNYRAQKGLSPLVLDSELMQVTRVRAQEISGHFSHGRPNGGDYGDLVEGTSLCWSSMGENIAAGQRSAEEVMSSWRNSPTHNGNMLGNYDRVGIGMYVDDNVGHYWVQVFVGTCD